MKALLLCLALAACTTAPEAVRPADIQLCAIQIVRVVGESAFVAREHCEPDGVKS